MTLIALLLALQAKDPDVETVTLDLQDTPILKVLEKITKDTGIPIEVDEPLKKGLEKETTSIQVDKLVVSGAVKLLLVPRGLKVEVVDKKKIRVTRPK